MQGTGAVFRKRPQVRGRSISFVPGETVDRVEGVVFAHQAVARHFSEDGSGGDGGAAGIAFHQRHLIEREGTHRQAVDQNQVGLHAGREGVEGLPHCEMRGAQDIEAIDLRGGDHAKAAAPRQGEYDFEEIFALSGSELFGVV